jgi:hypothetical protein
MNKYICSQKQLDMIKISKEASKVPDWLCCTKTMIPDFVARDPKVRDTYGPGLQEEYASYLIL